MSSTPERKSNQSYTPNDPWHDVVTPLSDVAPRCVTWLWQDRIPAGRLSLLAGRPGCGKSFLTCELAARISRGDNWPDGAPCEAGDVLLMAAEDDPSDVIRPRLDAAKADPKRIHIYDGLRSVDGKRTRTITLANVDRIGDVISRLPNCRLLVIDPIGSYLGTGTDSHRDNEVRGMLGPLSDVAASTGAAILMVAHSRKNKREGHADDLVLGSVAFVAASRAVWHVMAEPSDPDKRLLLPGKNNLARSPGGLAFRIQGEPGRVTWCPGVVRETADDILALSRRPGPDPTEKEHAKAWLREKLADGPKLAKDVKAAWQGSETTLNRASKEAVDKYRDPPGKGSWWWRLLPDFQDESQGSFLDDLDDLDDLSGHVAQIAKLSASGKPDDLAQRPVKQLTNPADREPDCVDPRELTPCGECGGLDAWQSVAGCWHCSTCDPPVKARRLRERVARIRQVLDADCPSSG